MLSAPQPLTATHVLTGFDSGVPSLDDWLRRRALQNQGTGASRSFVVCDPGETVVAYYALAASAVWVLAALGWLGPNAIIASWFGWSVLEVAVRRSAKPYVKEGPWWQRRYRAASLMDLLCYVSFKNLLIGAVLFIGLKSAGLLVL